MDALEFARELDRMCDNHLNGCSQCDLCRIGESPLCEIGNLEKAVPIVEKWSAEHPLVRNVDHMAEGLEKLGYRVDKDSMVELCPPHKALTYTKPSYIANCSVSNCEECKKWWLEEYKGEDINVPSKGEDISRWISTT